MTQTTFCADGKNWLNELQSRMMERLDSDSESAWIRQNWFVSRGKDSQGRRIHVMTENGIVKKHYAVSWRGGKTTVEPIESLISLIGFRATWRGLNAAGFSFSSATYRNEITGEWLHQGTYNSRYGTTK